jgi:hypothetical protein
VKYLEASNFKLDAIATTVTTMIIIAIKISFSHLACKGIARLISTKNCSPSSLSMLGIFE